VNDADAGPGSATVRAHGRAIDDLPGHRGRAAAGGDGRVHPRAGGPELLDRAGGAAGARLAVPAGLMPLTSTPVGGTQRGSRMVPLGDGPDAARFREALIAATERSRRGAGA